MLLLTVSLDFAIEFFFGLFQWLVSCSNIHLMFNVLYTFLNFIDMVLRFCFRHNIL